MKIDAISFDLDGTLIETNDAWHQALDKTPKQLGKQKGVTRQDFYENHIGVDMKKVIFSHIPLTEPELEKARLQFIDNFLSSIEYVQIIDNVEDVLDFVSSKTNKSAIITMRACSLSKFTLYAKASESADTGSQHQALLEGRTYSPERAHYYFV